MSIDRIGKGPGVNIPDASGAEGPSKATGTGATFDVGGPKAAAAAGAAQTISPAEQVRSGEISLDAYLDQRVTEATRHLDGKLPPSDLADIQTMLRGQLANDPALVEMVRAATGKIPDADE